MARRRKKGGHRKKKISVIGAATLAGAGLYTYSAYQSGGGGAVAEAWTGFNPDTGSFSVWNARATQVVLAGALVKKVGSMLGAGRMFAGLPVGW